MIENHPDVHRVLERAKATMQYIWSGVHPKKAGLTLDNLPPELQPFLAICIGKGWVRVDGQNAFDRAGYLRLTDQGAGILAEHRLTPTTPPAESKDEQPEAVIEPPAPRLTVDLACMTITLDGKPFDLSSKQALRWVQVLAEHEGEWISAPELKGYDGELDGCRPDHHCKPYLPPEILNLIKTDRRKGSRLRLP
ncbi:MAG: hypothetical protein ABIP48_20335 [Planctomycetota bacterium]